MNLKNKSGKVFSKIKKSAAKSFDFVNVRFQKLSLTKKIAVIVALVLVLTLTVFSISKGNKKGETTLNYIEVEAAVGNITETIEQSGVVEPYERYEITSLVKGEIISSPFEEGDMVEEGDTLYQIDDEDAQLNMEKAQMSLEEANENVSNLNIYAPSSGRLTEFSIKVGDSIGASVIGKINNTEDLALDLPFSVSDYNKISIGDSVTAISALYMTTLSGRVTYKYSGSTGSGGSVIKNIEIQIDNPGAIEDGTTLAATVHTASGDVSSAGSGTIQGGTTSSVRAEVSGEVTYIGAKSGDYVTRGQLIARLKNNSVVNNQKTSQINVKSNQKTLDNYNITAPISGTIITKNSKAGDKIDNSNAQTVMMVVADMSKMKFTITVDELDIADIKLGQTAIVDADAIPNKTFEAKVTSIASEGTSSGDGVTTFTVELTIDEPGELKSGMNVNANILINEAYNVITVPEEALMGVNGSNARVLVKSVDKKNENKKNNTKPDTQSQNKSKFEGEMPEMNGENPAFEGEIPEMNGEIPEGMPEMNGEKPENMPEMPQGENMGRNSNIPDGYEMRNVVIGISDGTNVEIVSGLSEGETVAYIPTTASTATGFGAMMMQMHGGGMPSGGGMPGGNRSGGGMPSGGMSGGNRSGGGMPGGR